MIFNLDWLSLYNHIDACHDFYNKLYSIFDITVLLMKDNTNFIKYSSWFFKKIIQNVEKNKNAKNSKTYSFGFYSWS